MRVLFMALATWMVALACGSTGSDAGGSGKRACTPGDQKACACPGSNVEGAQVCKDDGSGYGACAGCDTMSSTGGASPDAGGAFGGAGTGGAPNSSGGTPSTGGALSTGGYAPYPDAGTEGGTVQPPSFVNIDILEALAGPGKVDGTQWDGTGNVPTDVTTALATAAGYPEVAPLLAFMSTAAVQALQKPDPYGFAELDWNGTGFDPAYNIQLANTTNNTEDTFEPIFPGPPQPPGWQKVAYSNALQIRVTLYDEDLVNDDDMGQATIKHADILAAWTAQGTYWVRVDDQTNKQILAIAIQVTTAAAP